MHGRRIILVAFADSERISGFGAGFLAILFISNECHPCTPPGLAQRQVLLIMGPPDERMALCSSSTAMCLSRAICSRALWKPANVIFACPC